MTQRRSLGPGGIVEVDDSLLERDERRHPRHQLRHRRPAELGVARAVDAGRRRRRA
jgi:hypothetical protein